MASIPLPALQIQQPQDPMQGISRMLALKGMLQQQQQQQAMAPLQQEAAQQANQQRAQQLKDQQALTQAFQQWDGKNPDELGPLVTKYGGSGEARLGVQKQYLALKEQYSTIAKNDAETGSKNIETLKQKNDMVLGALDAAKNVPDEQLGTHLGSAIQSLSQQGLLDQQHAQAASQLVSGIQSGQIDPKTARQQLDLYEKGLQGRQAVIDQAAKEASTEQTKTNTAKLQSELKFYQSKGLAPGVPLDVQEAASWLDKNPGKTPADFLKYKSTLVPAFNFNLQAQGLSTPTAPTTDAKGNALSYDQRIQSLGKVGPTVKAVLEGRQSPPGSFALKTPYWQNVMNNVYSIDPQWSEQRAQLRKGYTVGQQSKEINAINTALGHVGVLDSAISALDNGNVRVLNSIANRFGLETGNDAKTVFTTIVHRVGPELSKAYLGAGGSAGERGADEKDFDAALSPQQLRSNTHMTAQLLRSKIASLENQWDQNRAPGMPSFADQFMMPEARHILDTLNPQGGGAPSGGGTKGGPAVGTVEDGYKFKGGNPADPNSWEKVK